MTKEEQKKILSALDVIRSECTKHTDCNECPICHAIEGCMLRAHRPKDWILANEKEIWRAFNHNC